jgi:hypothetical protein
MQGARPGGRALSGCAALDVRPAAPDCASWPATRGIGPRPRGTATVRASIVPVTSELPAELRHPRGFGGSLGSHHVIEPPQATSVFDIDDLAEDGAGLIAATLHPRRRPDPALRLPGDAPDDHGRRHPDQILELTALRPRVQQWAAQAEIDMTDDTVG